MKGGKLKYLADTLIGSPESTPLESRVLFIWAVTIETTLAIAVIVNLVIDRYLIASIHVSLITLLIIAHYCAKRYNLERPISIAFTLLFILVLLPIYWSLSGGTKGPIPWFLPLFLFTFLFIVRGRVRTLMTSLFFFTTLSLILIEKEYPQVMGELTGEVPEVFEPVSALFFSFGLYILIFGYVIRSYDNELIARQEAKEAAIKADKTKSIFLSNMSHEIRTPLNAIIGFSNLLKDSLTDQDQRKQMQVIHDRGKDLLVIINDIIDITKINSGKLDLVKTNTAIRRLVEETIQTFSLETGKKKIKIQLSIANEVPEYVVLDAVRYKQVLLNLLSNAVKFTEKGMINVSLQIDETDGNRQLWGHITDSGLGIRPENFEIIFNAFEQANSTVSRNHGGTGLGLAITRQLLELMQGSIRVESTPGKGSTFSFSVPLIEGEVPEVTAKGNAKSFEPLKAKRILVVEDDEANCLLLEKFLGRYNEVAFANDGLEALENHSRGEFDLILMDVEMPRMDGLTATSLIREKEKATSRHTPIIFLTAHSMRGDTERFLKAGADDVLSKPIVDLNDFWRSLREAVDEPATD